MASLEEAQKQLAQDIISNNIAGLMGAFTPAAMVKAMGIAANPINAQTYELNDLGNNEVETTFVGSYRRTVWSKWVQNGELWQIDDLAER